MLWLNEIFIYYSSEYFFKKIIFNSQLKFIGNYNCVHTHKFGQDMDHDK